MMKPIILTLILCLLSSHVSAGVIFEDNFDSQPLWNPAPGNNDTTPSGSVATCDVTSTTSCTTWGVPTGWNYFYINGGWWGPSYHNTVRISDYVGDGANDAGGTIAGRGGSGKAFIKWDESKLAESGSSFSADGTLTKLLSADEQEIYARIWIRYKPGFQLNSADVYSGKIFRIQHWDRGTDSIFSYFSDGNTAPAYIYNSYNSPSWGWRHLQTYRCDPQSTDYYCANNGTLGPGYNFLYPGSPAFSDHMGDGNWHRLDFRVKMNTYAGGGVWNSDGIIQYWYDGTLIHDVQNNKWVNSGTDSDIGWNIIDIGGNTQNQYTAASNYGEQWYAIDDVVVSTTPIPDDYIIGSTPVTGSCGPSNGLARSSAPLTGLCTDGTPSAVTGTGPFLWTCAGSGGGSTVSCGATLLEAPVGNASALVACPVIAGFK